jgi:hypothetical protein
MTDGVGGPPMCKPRRKATGANYVVAVMGLCLAIAGTSSSKAAASGVRRVG